MNPCNPFQDISNKKASISLQEHQDESIIKKKQGRPRRPNMGKYLIKMDKVLHKKLEEHAGYLGTSNSFVISQALREYFSNKNSNVF